MSRERDFSKIRLHLKRYRMQRAIGRFWQKLCHWLRWLRYLKYLNPFRYLNRLDRYIINGDFVAWKRSVINQLGQRR